ncbi:DUF2637 domain-containing protein [Nonomuraea sp. NPDC046802]|uniref:DUF2637 domain-containing protein n=1 Tax=Nonomuraea sp. NPDC046802 TaxID=3154919 RepID=UPI00341179F3
MDVTPPSVLRRLGIALAGLAVAALTGAACALSFDDLRTLAVTGEARQDLAFLYPAAFDALLVVALTAVLLLRSARPVVRVQAAFVLVLLIVAAAAVNVATAVRFGFDVRQTAVGVALAPWIMLAVALWLWLLLIKHVQSHRSSARDEDGERAAEQDIVPFHRTRQPSETTPTPTPTTPTPTSAPAPAQLVPEPTPSPESPSQEHPSPESPSQEHPSSESPPVSARVSEWSVREEDKAAAEEPEPETRPVRWGDRVKPTDVLVHPRPDDKEDKEDADTQPHPVITDDEEGDELGDTVPHPVIKEDAPAPSGRLRSTPRPPEEE